MLLCYASSPISAIDFPIALVARTTNFDNSDEEYEQVFVGSRVTVKLGIVTFFGSIKSC